MLIVFIIEIMKDYIAYRASCNIPLQILPES